MKCCSYWSLARNTGEHDLLVNAMYETGVTVTRHVQLFYI